MCYNDNYCFGLRVNFGVDMILDVVFAIFLKFSLGGGLTKISNIKDGDD